MNPAIEFINVNKHFNMWHERPTSIKSMLADLMKFKVQAGVREKRTVLKNIDFKIPKGDFVGIMGRNGAGKSTLLKLIAGIYRPSSGKVITNGRIAPLLELGAGFATELNGLENIILNASILGFSHKQTIQNIDQIIEFSGLGEAIDRPIRNYSSGMLIRLGFSIAVHLSAEILLFDEILAVGDAGFQAKCLNKIRELHSAGHTVVLVTHNPEQVEALCNRCIVFDETGIVFDGSSTGGANSYRHLFNTK